MTTYAYKNFKQKVKHFFNHIPQENIFDEIMPTPDYREFKDMLICLRAGDTVEMLNLNVFEHPSRVVVADFIQDLIPKKISLKLHERTLAFVGFDIDPGVYDPSFVWEKLQAIPDMYYKTEYYNLKKAYYILDTNYPQLRDSHKGLRKDNEDLKANYRIMQEDLRYVAKELKDLKNQIQDISK